MLAFLLPLAKKVVADAVSKIPDDADLGEKLIDICILVLEKAVRNFTKTTADDALLEAVKQAFSYKGRRRIGDSRGVSETPFFINN